MTLTTVKPEIDRDRWGRPLVIPEGGGKPVGYSRWSSFDVLEDKFNLQKWDKRMVAKGLSLREDLVLAVAATDLSERGKLDKLCEEAKEAAKASAAATTGTALHALTEYIDRGEELPPLPDYAVRDLEAYRAAMEPVKVVAIEQFVVCDEVRAAGTFDRIVEYAGRRFVADIKTGNIEFGIGKIAVQLAGYAHSVGYDIATGERTPLGVDQNAALIIHLPAGTGTCELVWLDIKAGWEGVLLSAQVREWRKRKGFTAPFAA